MIAHLLAIQSLDMSVIWIPTVMFKSEDAVFLLFSSMKHHSVVVPFNDRTHVGHLITGLVRYLDPNCNVKTRVFNQYGGLFTFFIY
jgi:hypothetical protein